MTIENAKKVVEMMSQIETEEKRLDNANKANGTVSKEGGSIDLRVYDVHEHLVFDIYLDKKNALNVLRAVTREVQSRVDKLRNEIESL